MTEVDVDVGDNLSMQEVSLVLRFLTVTEGSQWLRWLSSGPAFLLVGDLGTPLNGIMRRD